MQNKTIIFNFVALLIASTTVLAADGVPSYNPVTNYDAPVPSDVIGVDVVAATAVDSQAPEVSSDLFETDVPAINASYAHDATLASGCGCGNCSNSKAIAGSHKGVYWNNNFDYLCDSCSDDHRLGDSLKRMCVGNNMVLDVGGSYRLRYHDERHNRNKNLTPNVDDFVLHQTRLYGNLEVSDWARAYVEMIDAVSTGENAAPGPRGHEEDRTELLNAFADVRLYQACRGDLSFRIGRQELVYGNQRLVSPLGWSNARRTFEGGKFVWNGEMWDAEAFWTNPMTSTNTLNFNTPDQSREFSGVYTTYKGLENKKAELFYIRFIETAGGGFEYNTIGGRVDGNCGNWLWEGWAAGQFGEVAATDQAAWAYTLGLGRKFECMPWSPTLWAYYDFATGDSRGNGFHHNLPLAHKYLGFIDFFGRRNIEDVNFLLVTKPRPNLKLLAWWHIFGLQNSSDVAYNVDMTPVSGTAGGDPYLGQEIDLVASYDICGRTNFTVGYSHFFTGDWYTTNAGMSGGYTGDADFVYLQFTQEF